MNLHEFDGHCVRITDYNNDHFDGICCYNNPDYNEHIFGRHEESLEIVNFNFFESDIMTIESLEDHTGPYGKFYDPYGKLEELAVADGIDGIRDILFCEENVHVMRMLNCLDKYLDPYYFGHTFTWGRETVEALDELIDTTDDENIKSEAQRLADMWRYIYE